MADVRDRSQTLTGREITASEVTALYVGDADVDVDARQLELGQLSSAHIRGIIGRTREMLQYVSSVSSAVLLVRRANAVEKLVDGALKTCLLLETEQFELKQEAAETHLRTQRRAGQLLGQMKKHSGGRPATTGDTTASVSGEPPTLRQMGISGHDSHRWQRIASLPDDVFETHVRESRERRMELTTSRVLLVARKLAQERDDDSEDTETKRSDGQALLAEYESARPRFMDVIWLDPSKLAGAMGPDRRQLEYEHVQRLELWLEEFRCALLAAGVPKGPVREDSAGVRKQAVGSHVVASIRPARQ